MMNRIEKGIETITAEVREAVEATKAKVAGLTGLLARLGRRRRRAAHAVSTRRGDTNAGFVNAVRAIAAATTGERMRPEAPRAKSARKADRSRPAKRKAVTMRAERAAERTASGKKAAAERPMPKAPAGKRSGAAARSADR